ncbi:MAG: tryptophan synthase subunit alpha [Bacillus sp. (in: firmicutes)]
MSNQTLQQSLQSVIDKGDKCFVPYIMAGDGGLDKLIPQLEFLQSAGATMIEIGIPFSDPAADGPVIQEAGIRALQAGTTIQGILAALENVRQTVTIPLLFMTYLNPILSVGVETFAETCRKIGIDGCIIPDLPLEEEQDIKPILQQNDIALIRLASITSPTERLKRLADGAEGFIYAVTVKGVTGIRSDFSTDPTHYVQALKQMSAVPVLAGFGISTPEHVRKMSSICDGVIVGSQIIQHLQNREEHQIEVLIQAAKKSLSIE